MSEIETAVVPVDIPPAMPPEQPKLTLEAILGAILDYDDTITIPVDTGALEAIKLDPEQLRVLLVEKIDSYKLVIERKEHDAEFFRQQAAPFMEAAYSLERDVARIKKLMAFVMQKMGFGELPGKLWRAKLQNNNPALEITQRECTATDYQRYPNYTRQIRGYAWDEAAIKTALVDKRNAAIADAEAKNLPAPDEREFKLENMPFCKLNIGRHVRFYLNKKGKK